jgi:hypothetical protein
VLKATGNHQKSVQEIKEYLDYYDNLSGSITPKGENRDSFVPKARTKPS